MGVEIQLLECYVQSAFQKVWGKTIDLLIAFIGYVNDQNKLRQFKVSVQRSHHRLQCTFQLRRATHTIVKRVEKSIEFDGGIFEHLLWTVAI